MSSSKEGSGRAWALRESWSCCVAFEIRLESSRIRAVEDIFGLKRWNLGFPLEKVLSNKDVK